MRSCQYNYDYHFEWHKITARVRKSAPSHPSCQDNWCTGAQQCSIFLVESRFLVIKINIKDHSWYCVFCQSIDDNNNAWGLYVEVMSCVRFEQIWRYFHLCNLDHQVPRGQMTSFSKVRELLNFQFESQYNTHSELTIEEAMIKFKDRAVSFDTS